MEVSLVDYPAYIQGLESTPWIGNAEASRALVKVTRQGWADEPNSHLLASKPLPHGLAGLTLRMSPSQVKAVLPGVQISDDGSDGVQSVDFRFSNGNKVGLMVFHNQLAVIWYEQHDVPPQEFDKLRHRLLEQFGPTTAVSRVGPNETSPAWIGNEVILEYSFVPQDWREKGHLPYILARLEDRQLSDEYLV